MVASGTPPIDGVVRTADGRDIGYAEWGLLDGIPVVLLHGSPGSRLMCPDEEATRSRGVRLITFDRPGYGRSDPGPARTVIGLVDDLLAVIDALEVDTCRVVGWSGGGPYALAATTVGVDRVAAAATIAGPGPRAETEAIDDVPEPARIRMHRFRDGDESAVDEVRSLLAGWAADPAQILDEVLARDESDPDLKVLSDPRVAEAFRTKWTEAARQGAEGMVADWRAFALDWGFPLDEIDRPVTIWHGDEDPIVPVDHARYLGGVIPGANLIVVPGAGHSLAVTHWGPILDGLTAR